MKKQLVIAILCVLLVGLCACGSNKTNTPSATTTAPTTSTKETTVTSSIPELITDKNDPYAGVVKERYNILFDKEVSTIVRHYIYYDIDGNGIEELLLGAETHYGIVINSVYTIKDGVTVRQEALPGWMWEFPQRRSLFKNGTIRINGESWSGSGYGYLRFEDSELKHKGGVLIEHDEYFRSYGNGGENVPITKEEFDRVRKEYEGDGQVVELNWKPLAEYGR